MEKIEAEFHKIPARSPDLNPIENVFHLAKKSLENEALLIIERQKVPRLFSAGFKILGKSVN